MTAPEMVRTPPRFRDTLFSLSPEDLAERAISLGLPPDAFSGPTLMRLADRIDDSGGPDACWPWQGTLQGAGYGVLTLGGTSRGPHRLMYVLAVAPLSDRRLQILHACDTPACCNPGHLRPGTAGENAAEASQRGRMKGRIYPVHVREQIPGLVHRRMALSRSRSEAFAFVAAIFGLSPDYVGSLYDRARRAQQASRAA